MQCEFFASGRCGSCGWLDRAYPDQLAAKDAELHALLDVHRPQAWLAPVASPEQGFRNKAKMAVLGDAAAPLLGIVNARGEAVSLCDCPLYPAPMQALLRYLEGWIAEAGLTPYRVDARRGELKFVLLTRSRASGEFMLRFVLRSEAELPGLRRALPALLAAFPQIRVVSANLQPIHMAVLEGEREIALSEEQRLREVFNDVPLYLRPKGFFQTNPSVAEALYATARAWVRELPASVVWDLFCGVGGFGLHCATAQTRLVGIEVEAEAIACARASAEEIGLPQVEFAALDSAEFVAQGRERPDVVIVNPPRRGLGEALCERLVGVSPTHILYSSCNPTTLARDLARLTGYRLDRVQLFDMFPHTSHYEVLVRLSRT